MHPNKRQFMGILTAIDVASDKAPSGARGHRVILTRQAAEQSMESLIGMGINISSDLAGHNARSKVGIFETAEINGNEIVVSGYLFSMDCPEIISQIEASEELGMSYEMADVLVEDMRQTVWKIMRMTFTGAAVMLRNKAAYRMTDFILL